MLLNDLPWPKRGDNPFKVNTLDYSSSTWASLKNLEYLQFDDAALSNAFKTVADKAIAEIEAGDRYPRPDALFLPIAYLFRHSLELKLKALIKLGFRLKLLEMTDKHKEHLGGHNLHKLWNIAREMLEKFWPNGSTEELNAAGGILQAFHNVDKSGQSLRYTTDTGGSRTLSSLPESADLRHVRSIFEGIYNLLSGSMDGFMNAIDCLEENRRDCQSDYGGDY